MNYVNVEEYGYRFYYKRKQVKPFANGKRIYNEIWEVFDAYHQHHAPIGSVLYSKDIPIDLMNSMVDYVVESNYRYLITYYRVTPKAYSKLKKKELKED